MTYRKLTMIFMYIALVMAIIAFCMFGYHPIASIITAAVATVPAYISSVFDRLDDEKQY